MGLQCSAHESGIIAEGRNEDLACRKMQRQPQRARDRGQDCGNRLFGLARQSRQSIHIFSLAMHRCPLFQGRRPAKFRLAPLTVWVQTICRDLCHYLHSRSPAANPKIRALQRPPPLAPIIDPYPRKTRETCWETSDRLDEVEWFNNLCL